MNKFIYHSQYTISNLSEWNLNLKSVLIYRIDAILIEFYLLGFHLILMGFGIIQNILALLGIGILFF